MSSPADQPFHVHCASAQLRAIERLQIKSEKAGYGPATLAALKAIHQQLSQRPLEFGEPAYRLKRLKLQVRSGFVEPLTVRYAVHEELPHVFVMQVQVLSRFTR